MLFCHYNQCPDAQIKYRKPNNNQNDPCALDNVYTGHQHISVQIFSTCAK